MNQDDQKTVTFGLAVLFHAAKLASGVANPEPAKSFDLAKAMMDEGASRDLLPLGAD